MYLLDRGYKRLSNFLLWQLAYTEFFFLKKLCTDFKSTDLSLIIKKYKNIKEITEIYELSNLN